MTIKNIKVNKLTKREIDRNKKLARQYKGISYRTDENVFIVRIRIGTDLKGKAVYFLPVKRYTNFDEALKRLYEVKEMVSKGVEAEKRLTFFEVHEILKEILKNQEGNQSEVRRGRAVNTLRQRCSAFNMLMKIAPYIYNKSIDEVSGNELLEFLKKWVETKSAKNNDKTPTPEQVNKQFTHIYSVLTKNTYVEVTEKINERNINIDKLKKIFNVRLTAESTRTVGEAKTEIIYNFDEVKKLWHEVSIIKEAEKNNSIRTTKLCFKLQILTGARLSELAGLLKMDIMKKPIFEGGYCINIYKQKSSKKSGIQPLKTEDSKRIVPITEEMYSELLKYALENNISENDFIFSRFIKSKNNLEDYSAGTIKNGIQAIERAAGIEHTENRATHGFRHTLITYFGVSGIGLELDIIDKFVGHKDNVDSVSKQFYRMKQPTAIDFKKFITAQMAYAYCLTNDEYEDNLPKLFKIYSEIVDKKFLIERGKISAYENLLKAEEPFSKTITIKNNELKNGLKVRIINEVSELDYKGEEKEKINEVLTKLNAYRKLSEIEMLNKEYENLPRKERLSISREDYIQQHKSKIVFQSEILEQMNKINDIINSDEYKKYYYYNVMSESYRKNNSFDDFMLDIKEGIIDTDFNKPYKQRQDFEHIYAYAESKGLLEIKYGLKFSKPIKFESKSKFGTESESDQCAKKDTNLS